MTQAVIGSSGTNTLTVSSEDSTVTPAAGNPQSVAVNIAGGTAGPITLTGMLKETVDGSPGNISNAVVTVTLAPAIAGGVAIACVVTNAAGSLTATCPNVPVEAYVVQWRVAGGFYQGGAVDTVLAVFDPSLGFVTGSGSATNNGVPADFALSLKYKKDGSLDGGLTYVEHRATGDVTVSTISVASMSIVGNTAVVLGRASVQGTGTYPIQLTVTDNGSPGINHDLLGLQLTGSALNPPIAFVPAAITAGNIQIH